MRASDLLDRALDWAVEECLGKHGVRPATCFDCKHHEERAIQDGSAHYCWHPKSEIQWDSCGGGDYFGEGISVNCGVHRLCPITALTPEPYSTSWSQGGPIIEQEGMTLMYQYGDGYDAYKHTGHKQRGPTPLIAAMRCYVASKLGDEVDIPEELK